MQNNEAYYTRAIYTALRIGFIALLLYGSFLIVKPFIMLFLWGIIISVTFYPLFKKLAKKMGGRKKRAAIIITVAGLAIFIIPSILLIDSTAHYLTKVAEQMEAGTFHIKPPKKKVADWPVVGKQVYETWELFSTNMVAAVNKFKPQIRKIAPKVLSLATGLGTTWLLFIGSILIAGILLVFSKSAERAAGSIFDTLIGPQSENFVSLSASIIRSVVQGILGIAVIQSTLSAIGMFYIGIPAAGLWTLIVFFMVILQLAPSMVMIPIALYSFTIVDTTTAIIFSLYVILVSVVDMILKPLLLGRGVNVPMLVVFIGAIGGLIRSGIIGMFVGAVVLAIIYKIFQALLVEDVLDKNLSPDGGSPDKIQTKE